MNLVPVPISEKIILIQIQCVTADASTFKTRTARIGWKPSVAGLWRYASGQQVKTIFMGNDAQLQKGRGQVVRRKQGKVPLQFEKYKKECINSCKSLSCNKVGFIWLYGRVEFAYFYSLWFFNKIWTYNIWFWRGKCHTLQEKYLIVPFWHLSKFEFL